jgi:hypothetical protein
MLAPSKLLRNPMAPGERITVRYHREELDHDTIANEPLLRAERVVSLVNTLHRDAVLMSNPGSCIWRFEPRRNR